jgi:hypothetical protein
LNDALLNKIDSGAAKVALQLPCKAGIDKVLPCGYELLIVEKFVEKTLSDANRGEVVHLNDPLLERYATVHITQPPIKRLNGYTISF